MRVTNVTSIVDTEAGVCGRKALLTFECFGIIVMISLELSRRWWKKFWTVSLEVVSKYKLTFWSSIPKHRAIDD